MKVSFILPAYKGRFLAESIQSILAQTYDNLELIIVDDCSPDDVKGIVGRFHDQRLTYHRNEMNIGGKDLIAAWSHAMEFATGDWCVLASDDDVYHPDYLKEMVALAQKHPEVDLVHCRDCVIDAEGRVLSVGASRAEVETGLQMLYSASVLRSFQRMADLMFRKSVYDRYGFPRFPLAWYSDWATATLFAWEHGAACSPRILFRFRHAGESLSDVGVRYVNEKIEAGVQFLEWVDGLLGRNANLGEDDELLRPLIRSGVENNIFFLIKQQLAGLSATKFFRVVARSRMPTAWKRRERLSRIASWLNPRCWLPKWK